MYGPKTGEMMFLISMIGFIGWGLIEFVLWVIGNLNWAPV